MAIASELDHIAVPGTAISVREDELFTWPTIRSVDKSMRNDFEDEDPWHTYKPREKTVSLRDFPATDQKWVVVESGARHGKSTILRATARRLATMTTFVPAYIHAEALPAHATIQDYLLAVVNLARYGHILCRRHRRSGHLS